jgi:hypothetical protein
MHLLAFWQRLRTQVLHIFVLGMRPDVRLRLLLQAEPYTVTCPAHAPKQLEPQQQQQQQQPNHAEPKLHCRTTTNTGGRLNAAAAAEHGAAAAAAATGTPSSAKLAAAAAAAGHSPMEVDAVGFESDVTPTVAAAARGSWAGGCGSGSASKPGSANVAAAAAAGGGGAVDDEEMNAAAAVLLSGFRRARGGQVGE